MNNIRKSPARASFQEHLARRIVCVVLGVLFLFSGVVCLYADRMLSQINYAAQDTPSHVQTGELFGGVNGKSNGTSSAKSGLVGGLYHDDAINNILLLGVDDYQKNDIGRSDSMMMVSVDSRHSKLKLTSFMRDMYVAIPGFKSNRINTAYSDGGGGPDGAKLLVSTLEANFGTDIDRYVIISNSAFDQIIDMLGGVTITLTAGEAKLINQNSGDSRRNLTAGTFNLSGKQAHYYSRIRAIGDDFARTERQRKVFSSIVSKLKSSNIATIYSTLYEVLPLVTTNMTKNEILGMAANSLTYLNYPISQNRVPGDSDYHSERVSIGGSPADVLVPDLQKCSQNLASFIYESDIPDKQYED